MEKETRIVVPSDEDEDEETESDPEIIMTE